MLGYVNRLVVKDLNSECFLSKPGSDSSASGNCQHGSGSYNPPFISPNISSCGGGGAIDERLRGTSMVSLFFLSRHIYHSAPAAPHSPVICSIPMMLDRLGQPSGTSAAKT